VTGRSEARLRSAGLRVTRARVAILDALAATGGHPSADEVASVLAAAGMRVPRASLYHVLGTFARAGLLTVADAGPGPVRYEVAGAWHHHLVCRRCARIVDVPCQSGHQPCLEPELPGVRVDEAQVIYRGLCAECASL